MCLKNSTTILFIYLSIFVEIYTAQTRRKFSTVQTNTSQSPAEERPRYGYLLAEKLPG